MTKTFCQGALASVAALVSLTAPARADVTPQDVWNQWETYMASFGYQIDIQPEADGSNLRFADFSMALPVPADPASGKEGGIVRFSFGDVALIDRGDGSVSVEMPASTPITIRGESLGDENFVVKGTMTSTGYSTVATGNPGDITYTFEAAELALAIDELTGDDGRTVTPGTLQIALQGAAGTSRVENASGPTTLEQTITMARLTYAMDITDPDPAKPGHFRAQGTLEGLTSVGGGMIPDNFDPLAIPAALADGYTMNGTVNYAGGQGSLDFAEDGDSFRYASTSQGGSLSFGMSAEALTYDVQARDIDFTLESSEIPFPVASTMGAMGFGMTLPVLKGEAEQDFTARLTLTDVTVPEPLWMMVDAGGTLPHDPVTAELVTSGKARLFVDIFDEKATAELAAGGGTPGEVTYFSLDSLLLKAGGATIAATGGFDIDNTAKSALNPAMPAFAGKVDLRLTGVGGLIGNLAQMGLIPMPQAMMVTGMIQQLGKPESGPDDVSALIEVTKESQLTVNGAPLPF
jgi:hypothetical protein